MNSIQYYISLVKNKYISELAIPVLIFAEEKFIQAIYDNKWLIMDHNKYLDVIVIRRSH